VNLLAVSVENEAAVREAGGKTSLPNGNAPLNDRVSMRAAI